MTSVTDPMRFDVHGAQRLSSAVSDGVDTMLAATAAFPSDRPGVRISDHPPLAGLLEPRGTIGKLIGAFAGAGAFPVRAILFDKNAATNWSLGWHQDRTICVRERRAVPGFGPWTVKAGRLHVAPPFALLARMVTVRIHLDPVSLDNAPLLIAPGSHRYGVVPEARIAAVVAECGVHPCLAERGDIWVYATPILHASDAAVAPRRRRVLQVDYAACPLPGGLCWSGL